MRLTNCHHRGQHNSELGALGAFAAPARDSMRPASRRGLRPYVAGRDTRQPFWQAASHAGFEGTQHEAARVHCGAYRFGRMAACGARAAGIEASDHRILGHSTPAAETQRLAAIVQRLRELGWIDGRNVAIEIRWTEGRAERAAEIAADFVRLKVDAIVTSGTPQTAIAKQATSFIPIVFATAGDPVGMGLVASLARPGGNVTGLSVQSTDLPGKRSSCCGRPSPVCAGWRC